VSFVALIDYGSGNIRSVEKALATAAGGRMAVRTTDKPEDIAAADRIVLPGQGAFADCMNGLAARAGVVEALTEQVRKRGVPFLGICVGMQLLADRGLEFGETPGLGWIGGVCRPLKRTDPSIRIPHMGWNAAKLTKPHPVLDALEPQAHVFFMHSFIHAPADEADIATETDHGEVFVSALARDNIVGVQFHPEKSQDKGLALLSRFIDWQP
jgi:imidazole glycerol-phosphate synthase subunit HisH